MPDKKIKPNNMPQLIVTGLKIISSYKFSLHFSHLMSAKPITQF